MGSKIYPKYNPHSSILMVCHSLKSISLLLQLQHCKFSILNSRFDSNRVGSLPFIFHNVYVGTLASSISNLGSVTEELGLFKTALFGAGALSTLLLIRHILKIISQSSMKAVKLEKENESSSPKSSNFKSKD